ncbi:hypothetical protein F2Q69_00038177 [Brassica cretica]|uniref:NYN domain-containing protein n=1 Tax=Brassica cretica TaxID=69181 RepID=A0A8S9SM05_BRACR|nr:hypothetical protein F2Q69_00038177 [Brassica cretica]
MVPTVSGGSWCRSGLCVVDFGGLEDGLRSPRVLSGPGASRYEGAFLSGSRQLGARSAHVSAKMQFVEDNLRPIWYYASAPVFIWWDIENCDIPQARFSRSHCRQRIMRNQGYNGRITIIAVATNAERIPPHI